MRVAVQQPVAVGPTKNKDTQTLPYTTWKALKDAGKLTKNGGLLLTKDSQNPERVNIESNSSKTAIDEGQVIDNTVIGVGYYSYGQYKILAKGTDIDPFVKDGDKAVPGGVKVLPESTDIKASDDQLTLASYNIENFSANPKGTTQTQVDRIAKHIVDNLSTPDILTLMEVQDNNGETDDGTVDASQTLQRLVDAIQAQGGPAYKFLQINPENNKDGGAPGANIRVGMIYNPTRVALRDGAPVGTTKDDEAWTADGHLKYNPGRLNYAGSDGTRKPLAAEFVFKGQDVVVVGNHLNSKTGDDAPFGKKQPAVNGSEAKRVALAMEVNKFVSQGITANAAANVIMTGDMNDYDFSDAATALEGTTMTDLVKHYDITDRSSYIHEGNTQVLDHIFLSNNLVNADAYKFDMVHVNSPFADQASDHDPVLVQVDFDKNKADNGTVSGGNDAQTTPPAGNGDADNQADTVTKPNAPVTKPNESTHDPYFSQLINNLNDKIKALTARVNALANQAKPAQKPAKVATKAPAKKHKAVKPKLKRVIAKHTVKKITGTTTKRATVKVYNAKGKLLGKVTAKANGKFVVKLKAKLAKKAKLKFVVQNNKANGSLKLVKTLKVK